MNFKVVMIKSQLFSIGLMAWESLFISSVTICRSSGFTFQGISGSICSLESSRLSYLCYVKRKSVKGGEDKKLDFYNPSTWVSFLESDGNSAMGDCIRRCLLNNGYNLLI